MKDFKIGDRVKHDFSSSEQGIITQIRQHKKYKIYVQWDTQPDRSDWYDPEVLINLSRGGGPITLSSIGGV